MKIGDLVRHTNDVPGTYGRVQSDAVDGVVNVLWDDGSTRHTEVGFLKVLDQMPPVKDYVINGGTIVSEMISRGWRILRDLANAHGRIPVPCKRLDRARFDLADIDPGSMPLHDGGSALPVIIRPVFKLDPWPAHLLGAAAACDAMVEAIRGRSRLSAQAEEFTSAAVRLREIATRDVGLTADEERIKALRLSDHRRKLNVAVEDRHNILREMMALEKDCHLEMDLRDLGLPNKVDELKARLLELGAKEVEIGGKISHLVNERGE